MARLDALFWWLGKYFFTVRRVQLWVWGKRSDRYMAERARESREQFSDYDRSTSPLAALRAFWSHDPYRLADLDRIPQFVKEDLKVNPDSTEALIAKRLVWIGPKLLQSH